MPFILCAKIFKVFFFLNLYGTQNNKIKIGVRDKEKGEEGMT